MLLHTAIVLMVLVALIVVGHLALTGVRRREARRAKPRVSPVRVAIYGAWMLGVIALALTAYVPMFTVGHLDGWMLWGHLLAAGAFIGLLLVVALMWSGPAAWCASTDAETERRRPRTGPLGRAAYWAMMLAAIVSLGTMMAAMTELGDTETIRTLIAIHRYAGLGLVAAAVLHFYTVVAGKLGLE